VRSGQREAGCTMIKFRRAPRDCSMTGGTIMVEIVGDMIRVIDAFKRSLVAGIAVGRSAGIPLRVATLALQ